MSLSVDALQTLVKEVNSDPENDGITITLYETMDTEYLKNKDGLYEHFLDDLRESQTYSYLIEVLEKYQKIIKVSFCKSQNAKTEHFVVTFSCYSDRVLIRLAQQYHFPRGFHMIWYVDHGIQQVHAFHPKFNNDDLQKPICMVPENIYKFSYKYSGSLGIVGVHKDPNNPETLYISGFSKNCASVINTYVRDIIQVVVVSLLTGKTKNKKIPQKLLENDMPTLSMEVMLIHDQCHGARVTSPESCFVITSGFSTPKPHQKSICPMHRSWENLVSAWDLPVDCGYIISGGEELKDLAIKLQKLRDLGNFDDVDKLLAPYKNKQSTVNHKDILGQRYEGFVITIMSDGDFNSINSNIHIDSVVERLKFKVAPYTASTMALRAPLSKSFEENCSPIADISQKCINFCERWCATKQGKYIWLDRLMKIFRSWNDGELYPLLQKYFPQDLKKNIGLHILALELIEDKPELFDKYSSNIKKINPYVLDKDYKLKELDIIIVVGPIGSGKSTFGQKLEGDYPEKFKHLDGDILFASSDVVMKLGKHRQTVTLWNILRIYQKGRIPVVSCGGGVFFANNNHNNHDDVQDSFVLNAALKKMGYMARVTTIVISEQKLNVCLYHPDTIYDYYKSREDDVRACVVYRQHEIGTWKKDIDPESIVTRSTNNAEFANKLIKISKHAFTSADMNADIDVDINDILREMNPQCIEVLKCMQWRYIIMQNKDRKFEYHITLKYDRDGIEIHKDNEDATSFSLMNKKISGRMYTLPIEMPISFDATSGENTNKTDKSKKSNKKNAKKTCTLIVFDPQDGLGVEYPHATINSSCFEPKYMKDVTRCILNKESGKLRLPIQGKINEYAHIILPIFPNPSSDSSEKNQERENGMKIDLHDVYGPFGIV